MAFVTDPIGILGEETAAGMLEQKGFKVVERNWRMGHLEIDLIAEGKNEIVLAEVKARTTMYGDKRPEDYVDENKKRRMIAAGNAYIKYRKSEKKLRFDIIGVLIDESTNKVVYSNHWENAFNPQVRSISSGSHNGAWKWRKKGR